MPPKAPKATPKAGAKKGAPSGMLAKLKMRMELQNQEEERLRKEAEEEERRIREEERLLKEQAKLEEAAEKERQKKQKEAEKNAKKTNKGRPNVALERMRAAGMILPDVEKIREEAGKEAKEKPKPKKTVKETEQHVDVVAVDQKDSDSDEESEGEMPMDDLVTVPTESDAELDEDDWEAEIKREERREERHKANIAMRLKRKQRLAEWEKNKEQRKKERKAQKAVAAKIEKQKSLRSPIICVLGHVDTGKTSLLDRIRASNVQGGEAGGITQQIGATFFPREALLNATKDLNEKKKWKVDVPGLLVIDTPGHESFTNLRSRGSNICDMAILVVDITAGLERQTIESIRLLRERKCPFVVALNKVDRIDQWVPHANMDIEESLSLQSKIVKLRFTEAVDNVRRQLSAQELNSCLYFELENIKDFRKTVSIVPTSAKTGEGIADLLLLEIHLIQQLMETMVRFREELECTVLEVKPIQGIGFTVDVILVNGELHEGDQICLCGQTGPIFTQIRSLLTPQPMKESRVKSEFIHHKEIQAAIGVKIAANNLEFTVPGTPLLVVGPNDNKDEIGAQVMTEENHIKSMISPDGIGVFVQSSTLGALEALLQFLTDMKIPIAGYGIGVIRRAHVRQVVPVKEKKPRYGIILAFDVDVADDAQELADKSQIRIFKAPIIYHLFDAFNKYMEEYTIEEKRQLKDKVVFPVELEILDDAIHNTHPIILPVRVRRGQLRTNTPLIALKDDPVSKTQKHVVVLGAVMSMEQNNTNVPIARVGSEVAVKINNDSSGASFGVQFFKSNPIYSRPTTDSITALASFQDELDDDDRDLFRDLVKMLKVPMPYGMKPF